MFERDTQLDDLDHEESSNDILQSSWMSFAWWTGPSSTDPDEDLNNPAGWMTWLHENYFPEVESPLVTLLSQSLFYIIPFPHFPHTIQKKKSLHSPTSVSFLSVRNSCWRTGSRLVRSSGF